MAPIFAAAARTASSALSSSTSRRGGETPKPSKSVTDRAAGEAGGELSASAWRRSRACWRSAAAAPDAWKLKEPVSNFDGGALRGEPTDLRRKMAAARAAMPRRGDA